MPSPRSRTQGCLLGGAIGDALGAPVEFMSLTAIRSTFGSEGIRDFAPAYGRVGAITDDTQMALFTAEGLLRANVRADLRGICDPPSIVHHAYVRWLITQGMNAHPTIVAAHKVGGAEAPDGWLMQQRELWSRRAPGNTCLRALMASVHFGQEADNDSKGCGTIMRVAPVGLCGSVDPFALGVDVSRLTHGHPSGYLAAGYFAKLIACLFAGEPLRSALHLAREPLIEYADDAIEVIEAIDRAVQLADDAGEPSPERVESLGGGWTAEEALSIALYCALVATDFPEGLRLAVNHSGDSDSTGSLVGNILGVMGGVKVVPSRWLDAVELREVIEQVADDLSSMRDGPFDAEAMAEKYPGW